MRLSPRRRAANPANKEQFMPRRSKWWADPDEGKIAQLADWAGVGAAVGVGLIVLVIILANVF